MFSVQRPSDGAARQPFALELDLVSCRRSLTQVSEMDAYISGAGSENQSSGSTQKNAVPPAVLVHVCWSVIVGFVCAQPVDFNKRWLESKQESHSRMPAHDRPTEAASPSRVARGVQLVDFVPRRESADHCAAGAGLGLWEPRETSPVKNDK
jgi:hypothetical protein